MPDVLIREVPDTVIEALKRRARSRHRSLQGELLSLLEEAAETADRSPATIARRVREALAARGGTFTDSTPLIRDDRQR